MTTVSTWRPQTGRELVEDRMPYGVWYTPDGSEWMFNRHYQVIAVRKDGFAREWFDRGFAVPDIMHQATQDGAKIGETMRFIHRAPGDCPPLAGNAVEQRCLA